jgi:hypothetical protein
MPQPLEQMPPGVDDPSSRYGFNLRDEWNQVPVTKILNILFLMAFIVMFMVALMPNILVVNAGVMFLAMGSVLMGRAIFTLCRKESTKDDLLNAYKKTAIKHAGEGKKIFTKNVMALVQTRHNNANTLLTTMALTYLIIGAIAVASLINPALFAITGIALLASSTYSFIILSTAISCLAGLIYCGSALYCNNSFELNENELNDAMSLPSMKNTNNSLNKEDSIQLQIPLMRRATHRGDSAGTATCEVTSRDNWTDTTPAGTTTKPI